MWMWWREYNVYIYRHIRTGWFNNEVSMVKRWLGGSICVTDLPNGHVRQLSQQTHMVWFYPREYAARLHVLLSVLAT